MNQNHETDPEQLRAALQAAFPDAEVDDDLTSAMSAAVGAGDVTTSEEASQEEGPPLEYGVGDAAISYYTARATHSRVGDTASRFVGHLPQVRVRLPATGGTDRIRTGLGVLIPNDRKILSAAHVRPLVGRAAERVELITAARSPGVRGARMGAIALYLCYVRESDRAPSFYILEAGTATGQPRALFYGQAVGAWIRDQRTAYKPTPFSSPDNYYSGVLSMREDDPDEPDTLIIEARTRRDADWYIQIRATYERSPQPPNYRPLSLILEAAARVGCVGKAMGVDTDANIDIARAILGRSLEWIVKPGE